MRTNNVTPRTKQIYRTMMNSGINEFSPTWFASACCYKGTLGRALAATSCEALCSSALLHQSDEIVVRIADETDP